MQERFDRYHEAHPEVYDRLVAICRHWRSLGYARGAINDAIGRVRWDQRESPDFDPQEDFKINDHYGAYYARLIMEREHDLLGFFETRTRR